MTNKKVGISVLIPTMNRPQTLISTIKSYLNKDNVALPSEIIIVDSTPDKEVRDAVCKRIDDINVDNIKVVYKYFEGNIVAARNEAMKYASESIWVFSDDDIELYRDTLSNVFKILSKKAYGMVGALDGLSDYHQSAIGYLIGRRSFFHRKKGHVTKSVRGRYPIPFKGLTRTEWCQGYFFAIKKDLCQKWGLSWDLNFKGNCLCEDLDFTWTYYKSAKKEGIKCVLSENVRVRHLESKEYRKPSNVATESYVFNRIYEYYKQNMSKVCILAMAWSDLWILVERVIKKETPRYFIYCLLMGIMHRKEIKYGKYWV